MKRVLGAGPGTGEFRFQTIPDNIIRNNDVGADVSTQNNWSEKVH